MNLKEYAELNDITMADAKKRTGLTHWKQEVVVSDETPKADAPVVEEVETFVEEVVAPVVEAIEKPSDILKKSQEVMKVLMKDGVTAEQALVGIKMIGRKSKYFEYATILQTLID